MEPLPRAYWDTRYEVNLPGGKVVVRIGEPAEALGHEPWVIVTAWNPGSRQLSEVENRERHESLKAQVTGYRTCPATGVADHGDWREEGLFVIGVVEAEAIRLGRQFGQWAVVCGGGAAGDGRLPKIVDCR